MSRYEGRIRKDDGGYYASIVRLDHDGETHVIHGFKGRHFRRESAARRAVEVYVDKIETAAMIRHDYQN